MELELTAVWLVHTLWHLIYPINAFYPLFALMLVEDVMDLDLIIVLAANLTDICIEDNAIKDVLVNIYLFIHIFYS